MWNFQTLSRPTYNHGFGGFQGYLERGNHGGLNRADGGSTSSKKDLIVNAAVYNGSAIAVSGIAGAISSYKGMPEVKGFMGFDLLFGLIGKGFEFWRMWNGKFDLATAGIGGSSLGLLCHSAAVNGTVWGAAKSAADDDGKTASKGWDYDHDDKQLNDNTTVQHEPPHKSKVSGVGFDVWNGEF